MFVQSYSRPLKAAAEAEQAVPKVTDQLMPGGVCTA